MITKLRFISLFKPAPRTNYEKKSQCVEQWNQNLNEVEFESFWALVAISQDFPINFVKSQLIISKVKAPVVPFHGITSPYSYFEEI